MVSLFEEDNIEEIEASSVKHEIAIRSINACELCNNDEDDISYSPEQEYEIDLFSGYF